VGARAELWDPGCAAVARAAVAQPLSGVEAGEALQDLGELCKGIGS
jgi:hypothetical protein